MNFNSKSASGSRFAAALWRHLLDAGQDLGIRAVGMEAWLRLRLERRALSISEPIPTGATTPDDIGFGAMAARKSGRFSRQAIAVASAILAGAGREQLVGLRTAEDVRLEVGGRIFAPGHSRPPALTEGRVTSACFSLSVRRLDWFGASCKRARSHGREGDDPSIGPANRGHRRRASSMIRSRDEDAGMTPALPLARAVLTAVRSLLNGDGWELVERGRSRLCPDRRGWREPTRYPILSAGFSVLFRPRWVLWSGIGRSLADRLYARSWLLVCRAQREDDLVQKFAEAFPDGAILAPAFGDHLPWLEFTGPRATLILRQDGFPGASGKRTFP